MVDVSMCAYVYVYVTLCKTSVENMNKCHTLHDWFTIMIINQMETLTAGTVCTVLYFIFEN